MFEKISPQEAAGHNSGRPKETYYCGSECNFKGKEISRDQVKETKKVKEKTIAKEKVQGMLEKNRIRKQLDTIVDPPHTTNTLFRILLIKKTCF